MLDKYIPWIIAMLKYEKGPYIYDVHLGWEMNVLKFATCLRILLFLNNKPIFHFRGRGGGASQNWSLFVDVIIVYTRREWIFL